MHANEKKCLSESDLGAYMEGRLSPDHRGAFERHLAGCKHCRDEFAAVNRVIIHKDVPVEDVPGYLIKKAVRMFPEKTSLFDLVLSFAKDAVKVIHSAEGFNMLASVHAFALRSAKKARPEMIVLKKSFDDINVELDVEKVEGDMCNIRVAVDDLNAKLLMNTLRVELISEGRELVSSLLENGETILEDIGTGQYTIKIHKKGKTFGEIALKIK